MCMFVILHTILPAECSYSLQQCRENLCGADLDCPTPRNWPHHLLVSPPSPFTLPSPSLSPSPLLRGWETHHSCWLQCIMLTYQAFPSLHVSIVHNNIHCYYIYSKQFSNLHNLGITLVPWVSPSFG